MRGIQICDCETHIFRWDNFGNRDITFYDLYRDGLRHQATFIHKKLFDKYGLYDEKYKIVSDWKFFIKAILEDEKTFFLDFDIDIFDMSGISNDPVMKRPMWDERKLVIDELIPNSVQKDYERLSFLEKQSGQYIQYFYLIDFIKKHRFPRFLLRSLNKLYKLLKIT